MKIQVIKRDGSIDDFQPEKIAKVSVAAGLTEEEAQKLSLSVSEWVKSIGQPQISSREIREKVIEEMQKVNQNAADLFIWYQKGKERK